jgi:hypothetical protein
VLRTGTKGPPAAAHAPGYVEAHWSRFRKQPGLKARAFSPALLVLVATTGTNRLDKPGLKAFFPPVYKKHCMEHSRKPIKIHIIFSNTTQRRTWKRNCGEQLTKPEQQQKLSYYHYIK